MVNRCPLFGLLWQLKIIVEVPPRGVVYYGAQATTTKTAVKT